MSTISVSPQRRSLGKSGIHVSRLAWGMWRFKGQTDEARALVDAALEIGVTLFDTADIYGFGEAGFGAAEELLGELLGQDKRLRDRIVLATKGGITPPVPYDSSLTYLEQAIDASLKRLRTDRIDLYQIHRPDILAHPHEVARAVEKAHTRGKIHAFGVSNYSVAQISALRSVLPRDLPLSTTQPEFSALHLQPIEDGQLDQAIEHNLAVLAWSPLGGGRIAAPTNAREQAVASALDEVAQGFGVSRSAAAYSWVMARPAGVIPIVGSQRAERIRESTDAFKISWTREAWYKVLVASRGEPLP